jgi:hypothetical protein
MANEFYMGCKKYMIRKMGRELKRLKTNNLDELQLILFVQN